MKGNPRIFALVVAAGSGARAGGKRPKQYQRIAGKPMIRYSLQALARHAAIAGVQAVIAPEHASYYNEAVSGLDVLPVVHGGAERQDSVRAGLAALAAHKPDYVLIHDAARPFLPQAVITRILGALGPETGVVPALPVTDTIRRHRAGKWEEVEREGLMRMQTPQAFPFTELLALQAEDVAKFTDDAALWLAAGRRLDYALGDERLRKVTTADDITWAEETAQRTTRVVTGSGFDVHKLVVADGKKSVTLGGVAIAHDKKLEGHSDADVVLHALTDALLGALGEGDIGQHFPPSDAKWKGADSRQFVADAVRRLNVRGGEVSHADITVICEAPKIGPHRDAMRQSIAELLGVARERVNVKATTTEGLGFTGRGEGIAAQATVTLALEAA